MPGTDAQTRLMRTLYDEHAGALGGYCRHLTRSAPGHAEDVVQETLLRAWKHPEVLARSTGPTRAWLFRVAHNIVIDEWRHARLLPEVPTESTRLAREAGATGPDTEQILQSWLVADALRSLTREHREALVTCYYGGRTVPESVALLGVPAGTVKSRLHYGLRALRLALAERGVER